MKKLLLTGYCLLVSLWIYGQATSIVAAEYFIDTDPGVGNATPLAVSTPGATVTISDSISTTGLATGFHRLYIRTKDDLGKWSLSEGRTFYIYTNPAAPPAGATQIVDAEYFIDTDPGVGIATPMTVSTPGTTVTISDSINTTGLATGFHRLYIRTKDDLGKWSLAEGRTFYIYTNPATPPAGAAQIVAAEYFIDTDPGVNNGTAIPNLTPGATVTLSPELFVGDRPLGVHYLYIRTKDNLGKWSLAERRSFTSTCPTLSISGGTTICQNSSTTLTAAVSGDVLTCNLQWEESADGVVFAPVSGANAITYLAAPLSMMYYRATYNCPVSGCLLTSNVEMIDIMPALTFYADADGDGYGAGVAIMACEQPINTKPNNDDCDDSMAAVNPVAQEICNGGIDDDCDGFTDNDDSSIVGQSTYYTDSDTDGYGTGAAILSCVQPANTSDNNADCNDGNMLINPAAQEICNEGIDDDCDGLFDDADSNVTGQITYYADSDTDGYGAGAAILACIQPANTSNNNTDCNDSNININPGAQEICNSNVDDNCNGYADDADNNVAGQIAYYSDGDSDGYGAGTATVSCVQPINTVTNNTDCNDSNENINPGAPEICNSGVDDDCTGFADDGDSGITNQNTYYLDYDGDNFGAGPSIMGCAQPLNTSVINTDCDDDNNTINPAVEEVCNSLDDNCNDLIDEGLLVFTTSFTQSSCGIPNGTATIIPSLGSGNYSYTWNNGQATQTATGLTPYVDYTVTLTDNSSGCDEIYTFNLPASDQGLSLILSSIQPGCFGSNTGGIAAIVSGGIAPYIYSWNTGASTNSISGLQAGYYEVTIQDNNGCTRSSSINLSYQFPRSYINPDVTSVIICQGNSQFLSLSNAATALWSTNETSLGIIVQPVISTNISVSGISPNGCSFFDSITIEVNNDYPVTPSNLLPADGAIDLNNTILFSWSPSQGAVNYDLYVWLASDSLPLTPSVANINGINFNYTIPSPVYGELYNWQLVSKGIACNTTSAIRTFALKNLPDLIVQSITTPPSGFSGQPISVSWEVKNIGDGYSGYNTVWSDEVYFSDDIYLNPGVDRLVGDINNFSALFPGESYSNTSSFTIPIGLSGNYYIIVRTNKWSYPLESDFGNNVLVNDTVIGITLSPYADLRITAASAPQNTFSGQTFPVSWTVKNEGVGQTNVSYWEDRVFLTQDTFGFSNTIQVAGRARDSLLEKDSSYTFSSTAMNIPLDYSGQYFLVFETDRSNNVWEFVFENNNRRIIPITILLTPPPDLVVTSVITPDTIYYGTFAQYQITVMNQGAGPMHSGTINRFFLATNPDTLLTGAITLTDFSQPQLLQGEDTVLTKSVYIPYNLSPGSYFNYIYTDYGNQIFEYTEENNNIGLASNNSTLLAPDLIAENIVFPDSIISGMDFTVTWRIKNIGNGNITNAPNNEKIYLSLSSNSLAGAYLLADFSQSTSLHSGSTINRSRSVSIPCEFPPGLYYVIVIENSGNQIIETNTSNNTGVSASQVQVLQLNCPTYDLAVTSLIAPDTIEICSPFSVQWEVTNQSVNSAVFTCYDKVYLSTDNQPGGDIEIGSVYGSRSLEPGDSYTATTSAIISNPALQGTYYVLASYGLGCTTSVNDTFPDNNFNYHQVYIKPVTAPDLAFSSFTSSNTGNSGQSIMLNFTVSNFGTGPTSAGTWTDKFFLSTDQTLNPIGDLLLTSLVHTGNLVPGQSYSQTFEVIIPVSSGTGNYYIIAVTDYENYSCEFTNENNNTATSYLYLIQPSPCDLVVVNISNPSNGIAGNYINVQWRVRNIGINSATGIMKEAVYLSTDPEWDASDILFGTHFKNLNLAPDQDTILNIFERIGGVALGDYYVIVRTDILDNINETNNENNGNYGVQILSVAVPELPIGIPVTTFLSNNTPIYYRIEVPPNLSGETMLVSILTPDSVAAGNQLYLKYGSLPTFSDFDFNYSNPLFGNQFITIPALNTGTIYLLAYGVSSTGFQNVTLKAVILPFGIQSIDTDKGGNNGYVTAEILGAKFTPDMVVSLQNNGTTIAADSLIFINAAKVFARFNLNGKPLGFYDVTAEKPGIDSDTLPDGFEIIPGGPADLLVYILHPPFRISFSQNGQNTPFSMTLEFKNNGTVDIPIPIIPVQSLGGAPIAFTSNEIQTMGGQLELLVPLIELNGPPGILRAGGQGSILLYSTITAPALFMALVP